MECARCVEHRCTLTNDNNTQRHVPAGYLNRPSLLRMNNGVSMKGTAMPAKRVTIEPDFLTLAEVQRRLNITRTTLYMIRRRGELRTSYVAGKPMVARRDYEAYVAQVIQGVVTPDGADGSPPSQVGDLSARFSAGIRELLADFANMTDQQLAELAAELIELADWCEAMAEEFRP